MVKATPSFAKNMQNAISVDAAVSSPISALTSFMPLVALGGKRSNSGNKSGDTALTSLWLRRLKPQEEPESLIRDTVDRWQHSHATNLDLDSGSSTHLFGSCLQEVSTAKCCIDKASSKVGRKPDEKRVSKRDLCKQFSWSEEQYYQVRSLESSKQRKGREAALTTPYTIGFGQGVEDTRQERILPTKSMTIDMDVDTIYASERPERLQTCSPNAVETLGSNGMRLQAPEGGIPPSSLQKPPLPPSHNKSAFSQQPASYKSPLSGWSTGKVSSPPANSSKLLATPSQDIFRRPSQIAFVNENLLACQAKADGTSCQDFISKETVSGEPVMQHLTMSYHEHLPKPYHEQNSSLTYRPPPKKAVRQDFEAIHVIAMRPEDAKNLNGLETGEQAAGALLKESSSIPKPLSECSVGSSHADERMKASAGASTTASFPWEMFTGAAGPSMSAREEFVEVYNRARNELKNYKSSSSITKNFNKDVESGPGAASGHGTEAEISQKVHKAEGVECTSHLGGTEAKVVYHHLSQKQVASKKYNCASYPEGEGKINPRNTPQHTFYGVHVNNGKEVSSFRLGRVGGSHVEPPAVIQKDCSSTETKYNQCRQAFASSIVPEHTASAHQEPVQPTFEAQTGRFSRDNSRMHFGRYDSSPTNRKENHMILSKRQPGMFEAGHRESLRCEKLPRKSDAWLQRWYPPYITTIKGSQERRNPESVGCGQDLATNLPKAKESDEHGACGKDDVQKMVIEKGTFCQRIAPQTEPKHLKSNSAKVLPSAAAMAIVGTVAKQFCTVQPEQKGSFAFWSGFGKPAPQTREPYAETDKIKPTFAGNSSPRS